MGKFVIAISFFIIGSLAVAQPNMVLDPNGFAPAMVQIPAVPNEKLIEVTKNWAAEYNRKEGGFDITGVTANSVTVSAYKKNAFFYRNRGEAFDHKIKYEMKLDFANGSYTITFIIKEIYANDVAIKGTLSGYFASDGSLKEGFDDVKPSLEATVNGIVRSHYNFIINYR